MVVITANLTRNAAVVYKRLELKRSYLAEW